MQALRVIQVDGTFAGWKREARALLAQRTPPDGVQWVDEALSDASSESAGAAGLFDATPARQRTAKPRGVAGPQTLPAADIRIPKALASRMETVACHRSADTWDTLYRVAYRTTSGERDLLTDTLDPDVVRFGRMEKAVRRDAHKMHAFVRFRRVDDTTARNGERFIAWYRPSHRIARREASFFRERFPSMDWSILTPDASVHWDGTELRFTDGAPREEAPDADELEELWCSYYASIFNPARVKLAAMTAEMPKKFWDTLPETRQIPELLAAVPERLEAMARTSRRNADSAAPFVPAGAPLAELRDALAECAGCELCSNGTRPVAGEGAESARIVVLGEQPGDQEEQQGRPFVGPAGQVLDELLEGAGVRRQALFLTNTVRHFRHEVVQDQRGKRRMHKRPTVEHASRCLPWFDAEMERVRPSVLVCVGATAARAVFGPTHRMPAPESAPVVRTSRYARTTLVTFHPAAILRARDAEEANARRRHAVQIFAAARDAAAAD